VDTAAGHVFLTNGGGGQVWMFDACSGKLLQTTSLGPNLYGSALDARRGRLYVAQAYLAPAYTAANVLILDTQTGALLRTIAVPRTAGCVYQPQKLAVAAGSGRLWVLSQCAPPGSAPMPIPYPEAVDLYDPHTRQIRQVARVGDANPIADVCQYDARTGRLLLRSTSREHFAVCAVDEADGLLQGLSSLTGQAGLIAERTGKVLSTLSVSSTPMAQSGAFSLTSAAYDSRTGHAFVLDNPASTDPTAGLVNTLITLAIP